MVLRATQAFAADDSRGIPRVFTPGALVKDDDPIVKGREHLFESVEATVEKSSSVERATAAPGEKRTLTTPAKPARGRRGPRQPKDKPAEKPADQEG